jgi:putative DNA primase/helicase
MNIDIELLFGDQALNGECAFTATARDMATGEDVYEARVNLLDPGGRAAFCQEVAKAMGNAEGAAGVVATVGKLLIEKLRSAGSGPVLTPFSHVVRRDVEWLWKNRIALGKLTLLCGDPGLGKSFVTLDVIARVTTGSPWPDDPTERIERGQAILISAEDAADDTILPRLEQAGADVSRVHALEGVRRVGEDGKTMVRSFTLADIPALEAALKQTPGCRLIVIDPVSAYLCDSDSYNNAEIRGLLAPLARLAAQYRVAIVMVTHLSKTGGVRAVYRAMGSLAFIAAARAAFLIVRDKDNDDRRLFIPIKNNIGNDRDGLAYRLFNGRVEWERELVTLRADDALAAETEGDSGSKPGPKPDARDAAAEWLTDLLAGGPMRVGDPKNPEPDTIAHAAKGAGYSFTGAVRRAAGELRIKPYKGPFGDGWYWKLPESAPQGVQPDVEALFTPTRTCPSSEEAAHNAFGDNGPAEDEQSSKPTRSSCSPSSTNPNLLTFEDKQDEQVENGGAAHLTGALAAKGLRPVPPEDEQVAPRGGGPREQGEV